MATRTSFSCGEFIDITVVHSLHERLQKSMTRAFTIELKADAVKKADTAGLQLLLALSKEVQRNDGKLIWKKPTESLIHSAQLLGISDALGLT